MHKNTYKTINRCEESARAPGWGGQFSLRISGCRSYPEIFAVAERWGCRRERFGGAEEGHGKEDGGAGSHVRLDGA
jgi:hypothetical protein